MSGHDFSSELFIADDDPVARDALTRVFIREGFRVMSFAEGETLVATARARVPACILLDVQMPGRCGLDILRDLEARDYRAPILIMSACCSVRMAVDAIKNGACDLIEKPFDPASVVGRVREAVEAWRSCAVDTTAAGLLPPDFPGCHRLTPRETEILAHIAVGRSNKEAARQLHVSPRTIEVHRGRVMTKLGARNAADLVRLVFSKRPVPVVAPAAVPTSPTLDEGSAGAPEARSAWVTRRIVA
jgi:FixJ family two-component response regulator